MKLIKKLSKVLRLITVIYVPFSLILFHLFPIILFPAIVLIPACFATERIKLLYKLEEEGEMLIW